MTVFDHPDFDQHELVVFRDDPGSGLRAIIALHSTRLGPALGGCRMFPYASHDAALSDVLRLSRGMTCKAALAGLPLGGGKAVIIGDPRWDKSRELLLAMGEFVDTLGGRYVTAEDSGTEVSDMAVFAERTRFVSGINQQEEHGGDPSPTTAFGVFCGIRAAVNQRLHNDLQGVRIAVQGIGKVGYHLVRLLVDAGAEVLAVDVNADNVQRVVDEFGVGTLAVDDWTGADVDVLAPCALGDVIHPGNIEGIRALVIAGAANNQLSSPAMGLALFQRGILYAPDYVINAGGLIHVFCQTHGISEGLRIHSKVEKIGDTLATIFQRSRQQQRATSDIADQRAREIIAAGPDRSQAA